LNIKEKRRKSIQKQKKIFKNLKKNIKKHNHKIHEKAHDHHQERKLKEIEDLIKFEKEEKEHRELYIAERHARDLDDFHAKEKRAHEEHLFDTMIGLEEQLVHHYANHPHHHLNNNKRNYNLKLK